MKSYQYGDEIEIKMLVVGNGDEESNRTYAKDALSAFSCGYPNIDECIRNDLTDHSTVAYLFIDDKTGKVFTYASLTCAEYVGILEEKEASCDDLEDDEYGYLMANMNLNAHGEEICTEVKGAIEIKYFATDEAYHSLRFSQDSSQDDTLSARIFGLIFEECRRIAEAYIGAEAVVLHAVGADKVIEFYRRCHMQIMPKEHMNARDNERDCIPMYQYIYS